MKRTNASKHTKFAALMAGAALLGLVSQSALALTGAGSVINNTAVLTYTVSGVPQNSIDSSPTGNTLANNGTTAAATGTGGGAATQFLVDAKVDFTVTGGLLINATPGQAAGTAVGAAGVGTTGAYATYTVQNLSNDAIGFNLAAADAAINTAITAPATAIDAFDATGLAIYVDTSGDGFLGAGDTLVSNIASLPANTAIKVFVASAIPVTAINAQQSLQSLQATAAWPAVVPAWAPATSTTGAAIVATPAAANSISLTQADIVFADTATAGFTSDAVRDGKVTAFDAYSISSAAISVMKTVTPVCDPVNFNVNPKNIPGAAVQYAITIKNTGSAAATLNLVTDALNAATAFNTDLTTGSATACAAGANSLSASGFGAVTGLGAGPGFTAPGSSAHATNTGATVAGAVGAQTVTIDYGTLAVGGTPLLTSGSLPAGSYITVYFNAFVQ